MTVPIFAVTLVINLAMGYSADYTGQKAYHVVGCASLAVVSFMICAATTNFAVRYTFICLGFAGVQCCVPLLISWEVTMFPGREVRAVAVPVINGFGKCLEVRIETWLISARESCVSVRVIHLALSGCAPLYGRLRCVDYVHVHCGRYSCAHQEDMGRQGPGKN
jgi:hypothetical protein